MTLDSTYTSDEKIKIDKKTSNQRIFFIPSSSKSLHNLTTTNQLLSNIRCEYCGIHLQKKVEFNKKIY